MELVEVVLQGVRGAAEQTRWVFPAGVSVVPAGQAEVLVMRSAFELLTGQNDGVVTAAMIPEAAAQARVSIVVVGRDQRRYRLLWDLQSGRRALQVMNGDKLEVVSTMQAEIVQTITAQIGFPQSDVMREIYFSFVDDLPSKLVAPVGERPGAAKAERPLPPGFSDVDTKQTDVSKPLPPGFGDGSAGSRFAGRPEAELRSRLAEIATLATGHVDVEALEFDIDGLQKHTFEIQAQMRPMTDLDDSIATLDGQLRRVAYLDALPDDFLERALVLEGVKVEHEREQERLEQGKARLLQSVAHLSDEVSGVRQRDGARPIQAAALDPLVRWGIIGGVGAIMIGALGGLAADGLRWVALLDIPAFGVAVFGGIKLLSGLEEGASARLKLARIAMERKRAVERYSIDKEQIANLLHKCQLVFEQLPEITQDYAVRDNLRARRATFVAERERLVLEGFDRAALDDELARTTERLRAAEEQLQAAGNGYDPVQADLAREAAEIERVLRGEVGSMVQTSHNSSPPPTPTPTPVMSTTAPTTAPAPPLAVDVAWRLLRLASDLLIQPIDDVAVALAPRAGQMIHALTAGRFTKLSVAPRSVDIIDNVGSAIPFAQLSGPDRDLVALAMKLAIVESVTRSMGRLPMLFDRVFDALPIEQVPMIARAMQFMGQSTQVICFTQRRELAGAGVIMQGQVAAALVATDPSPVTP
jgi:hypothetical protein